VACALSRIGALVVKGAGKALLKQVDWKKRGKVADGGEGRNPTGRVSN